MYSAVSVYTSLRSLLYLCCVSSLITKYYIPCTTTVHVFLNSFDFPTLSADRVVSCLASGRCTVQYTLYMYVHTAYCCTFVTIMSFNLTLTFVLLLVLNFLLTLLLTRRINISRTAHCTLMLYYSTLYSRE